MPWLLDTNILSEIRGLKPEPKVLAFIDGRPLDELYISAVTLAELRFGIERLDASDRREELSRWLTHTIRPMFSQRVLSVTEDILIQMARSDGARAQSRAYLFAAGPDYCRDRASPRVYNRHPRSKRLRESRSHRH